jgi:hypothetical protein
VVQGRLGVELDSVEGERRGGVSTAVNIQGSCLKIKQPPQIEAAVFGYIWRMKIPRSTPVSIKIDKLTNSIENVVTGESFDTAVAPASAADLKTTTKKAGWLFNWRDETKKPGHRVFKLTTVENPTVVQGLISLEVMEDHVFMHLIENAPFNLGKHKAYTGVAGNLVAYACKLAFEAGHDGNVGFVSKTDLIAHYTAMLGARLLIGQRMAIDTPQAHSLVNCYFKK